MQNDASVESLWGFANFKVAVLLATISLSLSLSHTHTHTHTHCMDRLIVLFCPCKTVIKDAPFCEIHVHFYDVIKWSSLKDIK